MRYISNTSFIFPGIALVLLVATLAVSTVRTVYADSEAPKSGERILVIHDGSIEQGILTKAATVREAFEEAEIPFDTNDLVEPGLDEKLIAKSYDVNIYRARPVTVVDGAVRKKIMSAYRTPAQIATHADMELRAEDRAEMGMAAGAGLDGASIELTITRATPVKLVLYGNQTTVYTQAKTVGAMLAEKEITLGEKDRLSVAESKAITPRMKIELWREGKQTVTREEKVDFATEQIQDADRPAGYRHVKTPGVPGKRSVTYEIEMKNGKEVSRKEIQSVMLTQPKKQVEVVGAKFNYTGGPLSDAQIQALGTCESGMTPTRNSGNGFYGAFQFMPATWRSVAPGEYKNVMPHEAPLDAQKQAVQNLLSRSSIYTQFPGCAKKMSAQGIL